jgi:hypothetical protein
MQTSRTIQDADTSVLKSLQHFRVHATELYKFSGTLLRHFRTLSYTHWQHLSARAPTMITFPELQGFDFRSLKYLRAVTKWTALAVKVSEGRDKMDSPGRQSTLQT